MWCKSKSVQNLLFVCEKQHWGEARSGRFKLLKLLTCVCARNISEGEKKNCTCEKIFYNSHPWIHDVWNGCVNVLCTILSQKCESMRILICDLEKRICEAATKNLRRCNYCVCVRDKTNSTVTDAQLFCFNKIFRMKSRGQLTHSVRGQNDM